MKRLPPSGGATSDLNVRLAGAFFVSTLLAAGCGEAGGDGATGSESILSSQSALSAVVPDAAGSSLPGLDAALDTSTSGDANRAPDVLVAAGIGATVERVERIPAELVPPPELDQASAASYIAVSSLGVDGVFARPLEAEVVQGDGSDELARYGLQPGDVLLGFHESSPGVWTAHGFNRASELYWVDVGGRPEDYGLRTDGGPPVVQPALTDVQVNANSVRAEYSAGSVSAFFEFGDGFVDWVNAIDGVEWTTRFGVSGVEQRLRGVPIKREVASGNELSWDAESSSVEIAQYATGRDRYVVEEHGVRLEHIIDVRPDSELDEYVLVESVTLPVGMALWADGAAIPVEGTHTYYGDLWIVPTETQLPVAMAFARPRAWDAAGAEAYLPTERRTDSRAVFYRVSAEGQGVFTVETVLRGEWLLSDERSFPVTLDPNSAYRDILGFYDDGADWEEPFTSWARESRTQYYVAASQLGIPSGSVISGKAWYQIANTNASYGGYFLRNNSYAYLLNSTQSIIPGATFREQGYFAWLGFGSHQWQGTAGRYTTFQQQECGWGRCSWVTYYQALSGWWGQFNSNEAFQNRSNSGTADFLYTGSNVLFTSGQAHGANQNAYNVFFDFRGCANNGYCEIYNRVTSGSVSIGGLAWNSFARTRMWYHAPRERGPASAYADSVSSGWQNLNMYRVSLGGNYCPLSQDVILRTAAGSCGADTQMWVYDASFNQIAYHDDRGIGGCDNLMSLVNLGRPAFGSVYYVKIDELARDTNISYTFVVDAGTSSGVEICDGIDNNCNGQIDEGLGGFFYLDNDGDGVGAGPATFYCSAPAGWVATGNDCDDNNFWRTPGRAEVVGNNRDENCDNRELCYIDDDNDGYLRFDIGPGTTIVYPTRLTALGDHNCTGPGEGEATDPGGDCNDSNAAIRPGAIEGVGDQIDQNCDGAEICYLDADNDGYARDDNATVYSPNTSCNDSGEARNDEPRNDCNDSNALVYPGRPELCDFIDNDCDNLIDEDFSVGAACDDADVDACNDGIMVCAANGLSSICENTGAGVFYPVNTTGVSTLADWSGNSITASLTQIGAGALPTVVDEGATNSRGVNLDGVNDMIEIPNNQFINSTRGWSMAMWVRPEAIDCDGNNNWRWLSTRGGGIGDGPNLILEENNSIAFSINVAGTVHRNWTSGGFVPSYAWTHVAFTYDATTGVARAYRNGALFHAWNLPAGNVIQVANPLRIGNWGANTACPNGAGAYDGMVDDIYVTGRSMSAADVSTLYSGQNYGALVNAEICDGLNNDCIGGADDASSGIPSGFNFTTPGQTCEGPDADGCAEGGLTFCYADSLGSYCGDGPSTVLGAQPFYGGLARDISGWNNHASINGATWDTNESAIYFDGNDDFLSLTANTSLYTPAGYTMELWARPQTDSDYWTGIMGQERGRSRYPGDQAWPRGMSMWFGNSNQQDGPGGFIHHTYGCASNWNNAQNGFSVPINSAGFTHIVVTMDARGQQRVYINGTLVADNPSCGANLGASIAGIPIVIGRNLDGAASNYFKGWMRNIAIYPYAVTAAKVSANFALGRQPDSDRNFELCDGLNNDCAGGVDDPYAGIGTACDGIDGDLCNEGVIACADDQYSAICNDFTGTNAEVCDSADNNCNGVIDENLPLQTYYRDADNDLYGDPQRSTQTCYLTAPSGFRSNSADCSDATALVRPGASERCNGFDDNCNGSTDELNPQGGGACVADALGICANGTQFCTDATYFAPDANGFIRNWILLGPFAGSGCSETPNPPFTVGSITPEPGMVTNGSTWTAFDGYTSGCGVSCGGGGVSFDCVFGDRSNSTVFAYAHVYSPVARAAQLRIGSDDASKVWLNGTALTMGSEAACRGCDVDQNVQNVSLNYGWNSVLIGVSEGTGGWGMSLRFTATDGLPMRDLRVSYEPAGALECAPGQPVLVGGVPTELCNGLDDDCDGALDPTEVDNDGDGFNECADGDCNDADIYIYPGAPDRCDGKVNNCSGATNPDPAFDVGAACDGDDADLCADGVKICAPTQLSTICRNTGPIRGFDFRNGTGTAVSNTASSGGNGTLTGYATPNSAWVANGVSGRALSFNGTGERVVMPTTGLNNRNGSIELWMRPGFAGNDGIARGIFETDSGTNTTNWISLFKWSNDLIYFRIGGVDLPSPCCSNDLTVSSVPLITSGVWSHWVATWEDRGPGASVMRIYVNGNLVGERTNATFDGPAIHPTASLGRGHDAFFLGAMDEVAFYDYPLAAGDVALRFADARLAPIGVNFEFCDGLDNDCDLQFDEGLSVGNPCDGSDADRCNDDRRICAANTVGTRCSGGAGAAILFNDDLTDRSAFDSSGNNRPAALTLNTGSVTVGGRTALDLFKNRNSYGRIPSAAGTSPEFTFAGWFRPSTSTTDDTEALVSRSSTYATAAATNCDANGFVVWTSGRIWLQCSEFVSSALAARMDLLGQWTHVAVTYDRVALRVYVNGTLTDTRSFAGDHMRAITWNSDIWLGQDQDTANGTLQDTDAFFGSIDDAVWYGHPVPAAEVAVLASTGVPNLVINYEFCDGLDNDCTLGVDNTHVPPLGDACTVGLGICAAPGYRICAADGFGTVCDGTPGTPGVELCNGLDDDCDGGVDEDWPEIGATCTVGVGACARTGVFFCSSDGSGVSCSATPGLPTAEVCDNVDNDCDGNTDEGPTGAPLVVACYPGDASDLRVAPAACRSGTATCNAGVATGCTGFVLPSAEQCDDIDWDCDGAINDGFDVGSACTNGQLGECARSGVTECASLSSTACGASTVVPGTEVCGDSLDNDCDGETDEGTVIADVTVDAVSSGAAGFDYSTCDITDGSATICSAVTFTVTVAAASAFSVPFGSPIELTLDGPLPITLSSGLTLPSNVAPGTSETFTYCWDNAAARQDAVVVVEIDSGCNLLSSDPDATTPADLAECGPEDCDGADNDGDGRVDELPDACFGNPTLSCVNDRGSYSCVPTLEDGTPECTEDGCAPSGDGHASAGEEPMPAAAGAQSAEADGSGQAGCSATPVVALGPVALALLPLLFWRRRRLQAA